MNQTYTQSIRGVIDEVRVWTEQNFADKQAPDYGVVEEVGELCHGILKRLQGIRGFDDPEKFHAHTKDALGDAMVYLCSWCGWRKCYFQLSYIIVQGEVPTDTKSITFRSLLSQTLISLSKLLMLEGKNHTLEVDCAVASEVARCIEGMANHLGFHLLDDCLYPTWHQVKERNWKKNPENAHSVAEAEIAMLQNAKNS